MTRFKRGGATERVRFAVVGLGYWGPNLVRNLHEVPEAEVVSVCDLRPDALAAIARRYPAVETTTSFDEVLADERIDAVVIATPVSTHHRLASAALRADKHVFIEKPFAGSSAEAQDLMRLADELGMLVMPGHTFIYSPPVELIGSMIDAGELGDVYFISTSRVNLGLHQPDVSVVWDLAPHDFSILAHWLEATPTHVKALCRGCIMPETPDVAFIDLEYATSTIAHVELSWLAPSKLRRTTVVGSRRMVVYDDTSAEPVRVFDAGADLRTPKTFGEYQLTYRTGDIVSPRVEAAEPLYREMRDFAMCILTGATPRSSAALGLEVVRMIEAVDASLAADGARVAVEPVAA